MNLIEILEFNTYFKQITYKSFLDIFLRVIAVQMGQSQLNKNEKLRFVFLV